METIKIIVCRNHKTAGTGSGKGKSLLVSQATNYDDFLIECGRVLGESFKIIYNESGKQITSVLSLNDGDVVYLSKGEAFQVTPSRKLHEPSIALLGSSSVGKTAITFRFIRNLFLSEYDPTIEAFFKHLALVKGQIQHISILDTAGMEDYEPLIDEWIKQKQGIFLVFSLELEDSFKKIEDYHQKILHQYRHASKPVLALVGNKNDMPRVISYENARRLADKIKCRYYEVSAFTGEGIKEMFSDIIIEIKDKLKPQPAPWYRCCCFL